MKKRYQVFISSTYIDLEMERRNIIESILRMDCFPVGMELFPSESEPKFNFIKKLIDESDFYLIIIAGRYGSLATKKPEKSYTELEFDYAVKQKKPIITLIHKHPEQISIENSETDPKMKEKLEAFRSKACKNSLVQKWENVKDLAIMVPQSIYQGIQNNKSNVKGWFRSDIDILKLSKILNNYEGDILITLPTYEDSDYAHKSMTAFYDTKGLIRLSNLLGKVNININLKASDKVDFDENLNEICIGGPLANVATNFYMNLYLLDFKCIVRDTNGIFETDSTVFYKNIVENSIDGKEYFRVGEKKLEFSEGNDGEWGFILKIKKGNSNCYNLILFAETDIGTFAIIDFFCENYQKLYDMFSNNPFFIAIKLKVKGRHIFADFNSIIKFTDFIKN